MPYRCERVGLMRQKIALIVAVVLVGVAAGLGAAALSALIHGVEILAFGQGESAALRIVTDGTTPLRRLLALMGGGALVTLGWWWLQTRGRPVVSVEAAVVAETSAAARPPFPEGVIHALLQIVAVGVGAPVGREVAPRELGALFAGRIADALKIDDEMRRVLVACGAAAGLAGVYHVPFAGAIFALEILLGAFTVRNASIALAVSVIATVVARIEVSPEAFYAVGQVSVSISSVLWAAVVGALVGLLAEGFGRAVKEAERRRCRKFQVLWAMPLAFLLSGIVAIWLPQVLGNGRSVAQTAYWGASLGLCAALLIAKAAVVLLTLRSGVCGGTLTPALALGAVAGLLAGLLVQPFWPSVDLLTASLAGSAAFLAVSMRAPLTALALVIGFTAQSAPGYLTLVAAVAAGMFVAALWPAARRHD